jgi:hypothetical protein
MSDPDWTEFDHAMRLYRAAEWWLDLEDSAGTGSESRLQDEWIRWSSEAANGCAFDQIMSIVAEVKAWGRWTRAQDSPRARESVERVPGREKAAGVARRSAVSANSRTVRSPLGIAWECLVLAGAFGGAEALGPTPGVEED